MAPESFTNGTPEVFTPDIWGDTFTTFTLDTKLMERYNEEVEVLKKQVRDIVVTLGGGSSTSTQAEKMNMIDTLERLGLSYHFEEEIEQLIEEIFNRYDYKQQHDPFTVALHFRLFRQHGYKMSSDVFLKFKGNNGQFLDSLRNDILGMLSLYEASHLRIHGDDILEEAWGFTKTHLKNCLKTPGLSSLLMTRVNHALEQPLHRGVPLVEARHFINVYEQEHSSDQEYTTLLRFAKLDFNRLQLLYKHELSLLTRYWKNLVKVTGATYARDRAVENYFSASVAYFEPQYSHGRLTLTKVFLILTIIDDLYDTYGTFEELQLLTDAIERWDVSASDQLPTKLRLIYEGLLNVFNELELEFKKLDKPHCVRYGKEACKSIVKAYFIEAKWLNQGHKPLFDEYLANALQTGTPVVQRSAFMGLNEDATIESFEWLFGEPRISKASILIYRLLNDLAGQKRGPIPTAISCYMDQYKVSTQEAVDEMNRVIEESWKDVNEELLGPHKVKKRLLTTVLNTTRMADVVYKSGFDGFTYPRTLKNTIREIYINPVPV